MSDEQETPGTEDEAAVESADDDSDAETETEDDEASDDES